MVVLRVAPGFTLTGEMFLINYWGKMIPSFLYTVVGVAV